MFTARPVLRPRAIALLVLAGAFSMVARGQATATGVRPRGVDIAVTYAALHSAHTVNSASFWLQGGAVDLHAPLYRGLGAVASVSGFHVNSGSPSIAPLDLVTALFGLRYTATAGRHLPRFAGRVSFFLEGLGGEANGFHSVFGTGSGPVNQTNGTTDSANSLAAQAGGGLDLRLSSRFAVRLVQADYLRTQLPNGGTNAQNNLRLAGGLVFHFGR